MIAYLRSLGSDYQRVLKKLRRTLRVELKRTSIFILIVLVMVLSLVSVFSETPLPLSLNKGKNYLRFNATKPFYVETFVKLNPSVEAISYKEDNRTVGYVNIYGGVGKNFVIRSDIEYEVVSRANSTLIIPSGGEEK
jgi:hypothetical protein